MRVKGMKAQNITLSDPIIMAKATDFAQCLHTEGFVDSKAWIHRFRGCHNLIFHMLSSEAKEMDAEMCDVEKQCPAAVPGELPATRCI